MITLVDVRVCNYGPAGPQHIWMSGQVAGSPHRSPGPAAQPLTDGVRSGRAFVPSQPLYGVVAEPLSVPFAEVGESAKLTAGDARFSGHNVQRLILRRLAVMPADCLARTGPHFACSPPADRLMSGGVADARC